MADALSTAPDVLAAAVPRALQRLTALACCNDRRTAREAAQALARYLTDARTIAVAEAGSPETLALHIEALQLAIAATAETAH